MSKQATCRNGCGIGVRRRVHGAGLALVALLLWAEPRAQQRMRFAGARGGGGGTGSSEARPLAARVFSLGCAVPGAVIAIGILLPMGWQQARWPDPPLLALVTGTLFELLYAYRVRCSANARSWPNLTAERAPRGHGPRTASLGSQARGIQ